MFNSENRFNSYQNGGPPRASLLPQDGTMSNISNGQPFNPGMPNLYVQCEAQGQSGSRYVPAPVPGFADIRAYAPRLPPVPPGFSAGQLVVPGRTAFPTYVASDDPAPIGSVYPLRVVSKSQEIQARLSFVKTEEPISFYIVPVDAHFDRLERGISEYTQASDKMRDVSVPGDYWAQSKVGLCHSRMIGRWVRCAIIRTSVDMAAEIFAVDYGFTEFVNISQLRPIPCGLGSVEPHAIHCALQNFGRLEEAGFSRANAGRALQELLKSQTFRVVVEHIPPPYFQKTTLPLHPVEVSITLGGVNVLSILSRAETQIQLPSTRIPSHPMLASSPHGMAFPSHLSSPVKIILTSFDGFEDFFGQFASLSEEAVAGLTLDMTNLFKDRRASSDAMAHDAVGKIVAAEYMGEFYRCEVVHERDATHFVGYFVDFGNTSDVSKNRTFPLGAAEQKFLNLPVMGMRCRAPGLRVRSLSNEETQLFDGKQIEVHLRPGSSFGSCVSAKIDVDIPKNPANADFWAVIESFARIATHEIPPNALREVYMIRFASIDEFYVGLAESSAEFHGLSAKLDGISIASLSGPFRPKRGAHCLFRRTSNGTLYRASVESVNPTVVLRFVDFGNVQNLLPGDELFAVPEEICKIRMQAIRSSSKSKPPLNSPAERAFARFVRQSADGTWQLEFLNLAPAAGAVVVTPAPQVMSPPVVATERSAPVPTPDERIPVPDVGSRLQPLTILPGTIEDVYVSWFMSPGLIFLGFSENLAATERMVCDLQRFYGADMEKFERSAAKEGVAVCARFPEDGQWYRAEVIDVTPQTTRVLYVDFGNTAQVLSEDLRALDSAFLRRPKQAIPCAIYGLTRSSKKPTESPCEYWIRNFPNTADYGFRATFVGERGVGLRKRWEVNLVTKDGLDVADVLVRDGYADRIGRSPTERGERVERKSPKANDVYRPPVNRDRPASGAHAPDDRMREVRRIPEMKVEDSRRRGQSDVDGDWRKRSPVASINSNLPPRRSEDDDDRRPSKPKPLPAKIEAAVKYATPKFPLELGTTVSVYVSYIENGRDFYAQLNSEYETIEALGHRVAEAVKKGSPQEKWTRNEPCLALWRDGTGEASWYRASVVADDGSDNIVVFFLDFGNEGAVARRFVVQTPKDLANPPPQAIRMRMKGLDSDASKEKFEAIALDESFDAKLDGKVGDRWCVTLIGADKRVINDILDGAEDEDEVHEEPEVTRETVTSIVSPPTEEPPATGPIFSSALPSVEPVINDLTQVYIPVARNVEDIWFHRSDADTLLADLAPLLIKMYVPAPTPAKDVLVGQLVVALYENGLYRAEVLAVSAKSLKLMLVDYGDIVDVPYGVFEFSKELLAIPRLAFRGRLSGLEEVLELYDEVPREVFDRLAPRALVEVGHEEPVDVKFMKREDGTYDVDSAALLLETLTKIKEMAGIKDEQPVVEDIVPQAEQEQPVVEDIVPHAEQEQRAEPAEGGLLIEAGPAENVVEGTSETEVPKSAEPTSVPLTKVLNLEVDDLPADLVESTIPIIVSPGEFYVVPILHLKALKEVREQLEKTDVKPDNAKIGEIYGLKFPYMTLRVKILDESRAMAIDRGSVHNFEKDQLVVIPPDTRAALYPPLCIKCHLSGVAPAVTPSDFGAGDGGMMLNENYDDWADEAIRSFKDAVSECETILVSFHFKGPSVAVTLHLENRDAAEDLEREMYGCRALVPMKLPTGSIEGYLGNVDVLRAEAIVVFFRDADKEAFKKLNDQLEINAPLMDYWNGGQFCAARLGIEGLSGQMWVRARVKGEDAGDLALWAVDKCEEFTAPKNTIRQLSLGFFQVPGLGTRLSISLDKYKDKDNMKKLLAVVNAGTFDREGFIAEVGEGQAGAIRKAELFKKVDGNLVDFGQYLLDCFKEPETIVPEPMPEFKERTVPVPSTCGGVVTHMESPSEFWVLRDEDDANLKQLMGRLADHYDEAENRKPTSQVAEGRACVLALPEGSFLRVQIIKDGFGSDTSPLVTVKAVDYGTVHCANKGSLFEIEDEFLKDPIFAVLCKLKIAAPENAKWAVEAIEAFDVILGADRAERHFNIQFLSDMMSDDGSISFAVDLVDAAGGSVTAKFIDGGFGKEDLTCADSTLDSVESGGSDAGDNIDEDTASDGEQSTIESVAEAEDHSEPEDREKMVSTNGEN